MAIVLRTLCDFCADAGRETDGRTIELAFGHDNRWEIDSCDPCAAERVAPLQTLVQKLGRVPDNAKARGGQKHTRATLPPSPSGPRECIVCDETVRSRSSFDRHLEQAHSTSIGELFGLRCPMCSFVAKAPQGLAVHSMRSHDELDIPQLFIEARATDPQGVVKDVLAAHAGRQTASGSSVPDKLL